MCKEKYKEKHLTEDHVWGLDTKPFANTKMLLDGAQESKGTVCKGGVVERVPDNWRLTL